MTTCDGNGAQWRDIMDAIEHAAQYITDSELREEVVQETALALVQRYADTPIPNVQHPRTYYGKCVRWKHADCMRERARRNQREIPFTISDTKDEVSQALESGHAPSPEEVVYEQELWQQLNTELDDILNPEEAAVIRKYLETGSLPPRKLGPLLGMTSTQVIQRLHSARRKIRQRSTFFDRIYQ